jgi:hypothetical protein
MEALNDKAQSGRARLLKTKRLRGAGREKQLSFPMWLNAELLLKL